MTRGTDITEAKRTYRTAREEEFPEELTIKLKRELPLRYGENPNQPAALYRLEGTSLADITDLRIVKDGKGGPSATNVMDVIHAMEMLKFFDDPAVAVMKHLVPSGFARSVPGKDLTQLYIDARDADKRSAFGSVVVTNRPIDVGTAEAFSDGFVEAVAAPGYGIGAMDYFKKNLRAFEFKNLDSIPKFTDDDTTGIYDLKALPTGRVVVQKPYLSSIRGPKDLVVDPLVRKGGEAFVVERAPREQEYEDMLTAWYVNAAGVRSNGIVLVKNGVTLAVGTGQQERVGAVEQAIVKAHQKAMEREGIPHNPLYGMIAIEELSGNPLEGAVASSDAFFPFRDSIDALACREVSAVIQPCGSARDYEVITAINEHKMAMAATLERCFQHF